MQRSILALLASLATASAANAASVAIVADQVSYLPGQTVTLSVVVDPTGAQDTAVIGVFTYDSSILLGGNTVQTPLTSFGFGWAVAENPCPAPSGACYAFNQAFDPSPFPVDQTAGFVISTITFTAGAVGSTDLEWIVDDPTPFRFFGLTNAPGATVQVVPEPATAALLALGLAALGASRRREESGR